MKTASPLLHTLIRNMLPAEKKYFTRFLLLRSGKTSLNELVYYEMYQAIGKMKTYDEDALKTKMKKRITTENSFKATKSALKEILLDSLRAYGIATSESATYRRKLDHAEILARKDMEKEALHYLQTLKKEITGKTHSKGHIYLASVLTEEGWLIERSATNNIHAMLDILKQNEANAREFHYSLQLLYNNMKIALMAAENLTFRNAEAEHEFEHACSELAVILKKDESAEPFDRFVYITDARSNIALLNADFENYFNHNSTIWQRFSLPKSVEQFIQRNALVYFAGAFINCTRAADLAGKSAELSAMIKTAKPVYTKHLKNDVFHFPFFIHAQLLLAHLEKDEKNCRTFINKLTRLQLWQQPEPNIVQYRVFATTIALVLFSINESKAAFKWANKAIALHPHKTAEIHCFEFCFLFRSLIEYDLFSENTSDKKNILDFITRTEAAVEVLKKQSETDFRFSILLLRFVIKAIQMKKRKINSYITALKGELQELKNVQNVKQFYGLFDFDGWVQSQIT